MKRLFVSVLAVVLAAGGLVACTQAASLPAPTTAPVAPAKAAEPAKPAEPTKPAAAPAKKVDYPEKGKSITLIIPTAAGGPGDISGRLLAPFLEKYLGVPVQLVNKAGAAGQIGTTELVKSKPDGYTLGYPTLPATITNYMDTTRDITFTRKDVLPLALHVDDVSAVIVKGDGPYKTAKDLFDAAKANPGKVRASTTGILGHDHLNALLWQQATGAKFAFVQFDGTGPSTTALLGGNVDVVPGSIGGVGGLFKSGEIRVLGILDKQESKFLPGVKTLESQGYKLYFSVSRFFAAPAGTPSEIVEILGQALKKAIQDPDHIKKLDEASMEPRYLDRAGMEALWSEREEAVKPLIPLAR